MWYGKAKREDPLKLLLPGVIYDYFELVHTTIQELINRKLVFADRNGTKIPYYPAFYLILTRIYLIDRLFYIPLRIMQHAVVKRFICCKHNTVLPNTQVLEAILYLVISFF